MAADRTVILDWVATVVADIVTDAEDEADIATRVAEAPDLDSAEFAAEIIDLTRIIGESVTDARGFAAFVVPETADTETREAIVFLCAVGQALSAGRVSWPSRPSARNARASLGTIAEEAYAVAARLDPDLYAWLRNLVQVAIRLVSEIAANSTPMVRVAAGVSLPSTALAYQLYGDATRAAQLVEIADSSTPMLMPVSFDALAS
ncbi:hypothetical protein [Sinorhizobium sp. BG8]|uniref:hypothetical protein n=1 Tax=Sinorhizobium sp. BG8 TaxID=2613773 RepID=UPI00193D0C16|nr:hypothetical protein [Sinorhizobium sp. BG8]QRM55151.1 hypothetical protein F3Y30_11855 [Sinorhizobium sp. BG8]